MRLLMTTDTIGGVWTYSLELARALRPLSVEIILATMGQAATDDQRAEARGIPNLTLLESTYKLEWMPNPWDDVQRAGQWLLDLEQQFQPDIIHLSGYAHAAFPFHAPILLVGHSCVLSWWEAVKKGESPPYFSDYRLQVSEGLHSADIVIAPTQAMLTALERHYGSLPRTRVIHNGRDPRCFASTQKEHIILTAGRLWDEAKNVAAVDTIAPRLPWTVYMAGENNHPVAGSMQQHNLRRLGQLSQSEMAQWFSRTMIYALPARYEPFGLTALEAALCGCALVLGDIESLREIWADAATFVPPDDLDALSSALHRFCTRPALRNAMAAKARERAARYTANRMANEYFQVYQELQHAPLTSQSHS
jgi:glycogen(starch) synthase